MNKAILFKALQRKNRYRNPEHTLETPEASRFSDSELSVSQRYVESLTTSGIQFTFPGDKNYPLLFHRMAEPPLFLEFLGSPTWKATELVSVVGSRDCHDLTNGWLNTQLLQFLKLEQVGLVSGGAKGVDMKSHLVALRACRPTVAFLPCGLNQVYPQEFKYIITEIINGGGAIVSEFELNQKVHKSFFYFRNRLIAALGKVCLVAQAGIKSGTMLTVHHALQNGRPVITIPAHPGLTAFAGNLELIKDGAPTVTDSYSLHEFWKAESWC